MFPRFCFFSILFLLFEASTLGQVAKVIDLQQKHLLKSFKLDREEVLSDCDVLSLEVKDKELYLFYSVGKKLFLRQSDDKGTSWKEEFIGFFVHELNEQLPLKVIKGENGYLHLLHFEHTGQEKRLVHRIRTNPSLDWYTQTVYGTSEVTNNYFDLEAQEDCNGNLFIAFHLGEGLVHQATYKSLKWESLHFKVAQADIGLGLSTGFDRKLHIAIAENKGHLHLATRYLQDERFTLTKIGESGSPYCSLAQTSDGGLLISGTAFVAGRDKPIQISKMDRSGNWKHFTLQNSDSAHFALGSYKRSTLRVDQSGRLHLAAYLTDYKTSSKKSLCYLFSNTGGSSWFAQSLKQDIYGYPKNNVPHLDFNETNVFVAYKNRDRQPQLVVFPGVNLKGLPPCLPRKNPQHVNQVITKQTASRIVDVPKRLPKPKEIGNPNKRKTRIQAEFVTRNAFVKLMLRDNREVDGDTVSVFLNGQCVLHAYGLQSKTFVRTIEIDPTKKNELLLYAETEGRLPPCTVALSLRDSKRKQDFIIQSSMKENGAIQLRPPR